ncbi:MAG: hypothetical protein ACKO3S_10520 [bacterium]
MTLPPPTRRRRVPRAALRAVLACVLASAAVLAHAAPLAPARAQPPLAPLAPAAAHSPLDHACGTHLDALHGRLEWHAEHAATTSVTAAPTTHSRDVAGIAVLEDDGTFRFLDKNGASNLDVAAVARAFQRSHGDSYDMLAVWLASGLDQWLGSPGALAAAWLTRNDVAGIGLEAFDLNAALGLSPRMHTVLTMNGLHRYPDDPAGEVPGLPNYVTQDVLAHEFGHRWLAYPLVQDVAAGGPSTALLGRSFQHWSFFLDADGSFMEGADWREAAPDSFVMDAPIARFGPLDQYLMGVRSPAETDSILVIADSAAFAPAGPWVPYSDPAAGIVARGPARRFAVSDLATANGARVPAADGVPDTVRVAFVLVTPNGVDATPSDLAKLAGIRAAFPATIAAATDGRMVVDVSLESRPGRLRLAHEPLGDTEDASSPRTLTLRVTEERAGIPVRLRANGAMFWWRTSALDSWTQSPMVAVGPDSFAVTAPAQPLGTRVEYFFRAEADVPGVASELPDRAHSRPFAWWTRPDATPPVVEHHALRTQAVTRLPQTLLARVRDDSGLDSVWCEVAVNGAPATVIAATAAGRDSFTVSLGAGLEPGTRIAYRFGARDRSNARHLAWSNPGFDTLVVGRAAADDFWNPAPWTHGPVRFNRRDEWRAVADAGAPAGSGAWHCGRDTVPYGPYQDAALASPLLYDVGPGTVLAFRHRFDLEAANAFMAWDGARVEVQPWNGAWQAVTPEAGYTHQMAGADQGLPQGAACWSGRRSEWTEERVDLSAFAPGPVRVRFRMSSDLFVGGGGWWVDEVRVLDPAAPVTAVAPGAGAQVALGAMWPNPAHDALRQALRTPRAARAEWSLHDLAGRRVATLWRGPLEPGTHTLEALLPRGLAGGLYFARLALDGGTVSARRVAIVR